ASSRARDARAISAPRTTLTDDADSTRMKCATRLSHVRSTLGMPSRSHRASIGSAMCISQFAVRITDPGRECALLSFGRLSQGLNRNRKARIENATLTVEHIYISRPSAFDGEVITGVNPTLLVK